MRWIRALAAPLCVLAAVVAGQRALAIVHGVDVPCWDRRLDGVGVLISVNPGQTCPGAVSGSCVLIAPNVVLAARHQLGVSATSPLPSLQQRPLRVRFRRSADGVAVNPIIFNGDPCHGAYQEFSVVEATDAAMPGSDLVMLTLSGTPVGISPIGVEIDRPPTMAMPIMVVGWGYAGACFGAGPGWALRSARGMMQAHAQVSDVLVFSPCSLWTTDPCQYCPPGGPWVIANLHDSGGAVLIEVPAVNPAAPPELRLVGTIVTTWAARRPGSWNAFGGVPRIEQASPVLIADFNTDQRTDARDVLDFLNAYWAGDCRCNLTGDDLDMADIFAFLNMFFELDG